jgi:3-oxoacyl-[acyl-carrier-protein] synthase-3
MVATSIPDRLAPATNAIVQDKIQAYIAVVFDISAV